MNELMKNGLQVFENEKFGKVRVVRVENEAWFSGVATVLGYTRPHEAVRDHCKHAKLFRSGDLAHLNNINDLQLNPRGELFINQADVLRLIARSTLPEAQKVESWIFDVVKVLNTGSQYNSPTQKSMSPARGRFISLICFPTQTLKRREASNFQQRYYHVLVFTGSLRGRNDSGGRNGFGRHRPFLWLISGPCFVQDYLWRYYAGQGGKERRSA